MQNTKIQNYSVLGYGTCNLKVGYWGFIWDIQPLWPVKIDPEYSSRIFITMCQTIWCPNQTSLWILTTVSTLNPVPKNIKNNWSVSWNNILIKQNYRTAVYFYRQLLIPATFSANSVPCVSYLVTNKLRKRIIISINTHFKVRTTYE